MADVDKVIDVDGTDGDKPKSRSKQVKKPATGKAADENAKFEYGDIVLARLRGYPPWPARITDPDALPLNVLAQRPKNTAFQCAQFFPVGDFAWLPPKDLNPLKPHQVQAFLDEPHRKSQGQLREAYETARDPTDWDAAQHQRRKNLEEVEVDEDVDELEEEEGPSSKGKRKRATQPKKETKKAKVDKKAEPKAPKAPKSQASKKAAAAAPAATAEEESTDPEAIKVKDWRHKLQRAFLPRDKALPKDNEMDTWDALFKTIEAYDMKVEYLNHSKIKKVMKLISQLPNIPRDDELKISQRADALMRKYQTMEREGPDGGSAPADGASANGQAEKHEDKEEAKAEETKAEAAEAPAAEEKATEA